MALVPLSALEIIFTKCIPISETSNPLIFLPACGVTLVDYPLRIISNGQLDYRIFNNFCQAPFTVIILNPMSFMDIYYIVIGPKHHRCLQSPMGYLHVVRYSGGNEIQYKHLLTLGYKINRIRISKNKSIFRYIPCNIKYFEPAVQCTRHTIILQYYVLYVVYEYCI